MPTDPSNAGAQVRETVRAGAARLRRHALITELSRGAMLAAAVPLVAAALRVIRPVSPSVLMACFIVPALALAAWTFVKLGRHAAADRTARRMDTDAALNDELISAHWFAAHGPDTEWTGAQMARAAAHVDAIDWEAVQPAPRPRAAWATTAVMLGLTGVLLFVPTGTISGPAFLSATSSADAKKDAAIEMLRTRLEETDMTDAEKLRGSEILDALAREGLTSEEAKALLAELEALMGKDALDAKALEAMADALDRAVTAKDLADALRKRAMAEAAQKARELAEKAPGLQKQDRNELADALEQAAKSTDKTLQQLADEMREAADKLRGDDSRAMKKSLEEMADRMEQLAKDGQKDGAEAVREQTEAIEEAIGKQGEASESGEQSGESKRDSNQSTGNMQGQGEGMAREAASMPNPSMAQMPGLGQMAGQPQGQPPMAQAPLGDGKRRIEVALKEEMVRAHDEAADSEPAELVDRKTERVDSTVQYRRVEGAQNYDRADAQQEGAIPDARRALVKKYFTALGPRGGTER